MSKLSAARERDLRDFGDPRLANPFAEFDTIYPPAQWRTVEVTDEMRAADAAATEARDRARRASITWMPPFAQTEVSQ